MSVDSFPSSVPGELARRAVAEIRICSEELLAFVEGSFERIESLSAAQAARPAELESIGPRDPRPSMQEQIDQLAKIVAELAQLAGERKGKEAIPLADGQTAGKLAPRQTGSIQQGTPLKELR